MGGKLRMVTRADLTIARQKRGRGFCYRMSDGTLVCDGVFKARVSALAIPPAWRDVRIAPDERAHIQCVGTDDAGRVQYLYHPKWETRRSARKLQRLALLSAALPRIRRRLRKDLNAPAGSLVLAQAIALSLIDRTAMRVGSEEYLRENGTRGAATLFASDVALDGDEISIHFLAKGNKEAAYVLRNAALAAALARIKTLPGERLLMHEGAEGPVPVRTGAINAYIRQISGVEVSAKDFRTLRASTLAAEALARLEPGPSQTALKRQMAEVTREVAQMLHNTPTISRKSYIAPALFKLFGSGRLQPLWTSAAGRPEQRLGAVLREVAG